MTQPPYSDLELHPAEPETEIPDRPHHPKAVLVVGVLLALAVAWLVWNAR